MQKTICPNGHTYDKSIYGDHCPLCPPPVPGAKPIPMMGRPNPMVAPQPKPAAGAAETKKWTPPAMNAGVAQRVQQPVPPAQPQHTIIRPANTPMGKAAASAGGRKLVGFLVTYNRTPMGKAFNIYEGRNTIGRGAECDVSIPDDQQLTSHHMTIRYLNGKFRYKDEMSSNGVYVNKQQMDEGELQNYDIVRIGGTLFIFIEIPQI